MTNTMTAEDMKKAGNAAFAEKNFTGAALLYTAAIENSEGTPSHIYFANRANAYLSLGKYRECILDCD